MKVLNFGSLNIDYVYKVDHMVCKGETLSSHERSTFTGGKGLNQSVALAKAGIKVYHAGCIGAEGRFLLDILKASGADISNVRILDDIPTGHAIIQNDKNGDNCILLFGGANQSITDEQIDKTLADFSDGDFLILQNEINGIKYLMERAHEIGMKIALNPSPMDEDILRLPLNYVDYFFVNEIEAAQITESGSTDPEALLKLLKDKFPKAHIIMTLGASGSVYSYKNEEVWQPAYTSRVVDTTAAGDTFSGYFIAGIIENKTAADAMQLAAFASSVTISRPGAAPSIPSIEELKSAEL